MRLCTNLCILVTQFTHSLLISRPLPKTFLTVAVMLLAAIIIVTALGRGFALDDFKVYYGAAQSFFGHRQVYDVVYATDRSIYKYSPFSAMLAGPFLVLPYSYAILVQYVIMSAVTTILLLLVFNLVNTYLFNSAIKWPNAVLLIVIVAFLQHLVRELTVGNINLLLLLFACLSLYCILQKRFILSGILLALVIVSKPFFVLLLMPLVLHKYYRTLVSTVASLALFALLPALVWGFAGDVELHKQWLSTMLTHSGNYYSPNTLDMILRIYLYHGLPDSMQYVIILLACAVFVVLFHFNTGAKTGILVQKDFVMEWFLITGMLTTLFRTDTQHFLFSVPLITIWCCYLFTSRNKLSIALFIFAILLYDGNSFDIFGRDLSNKIYNAGVLGFGNIIIIIAATAIYFKHLRKIEQLS